MFTGETCAKNKFYHGPLYLSRRRSLLMECEVAFDSRKVFRFEIGQRKKVSFIDKGHTTKQHHQIILVLDLTYMQSTLRIKFSLKLSLDS